MLQNFEGSCYPIFRCSSLLERGHSRSKGGGKTTIRHNGSTENIELVLQIVMSVNQFSLNGDMIAELPVEQTAPRKPLASGELDKPELLTQPPLEELQPNEERQENLLQEYEERFEKFVRRRPEVIQTLLRSASKRRRK